MSYLVLARKWRPRAFGEMVGQEHVLRALINALDSGRVHHAFLFTGTRGVGKTTVARILAKSLNCETGVSSKPCGTCAACREIDEGRFVDLIEVDAASRTKVDDTRELLDNVQYAPTRGRYKVYLIDEVHMLSAHSFNALLKTLEEPPPHVKFLLATTDPQKLPVTVLSRCLQFSLKRLPLALITARLTQILTAEKVEFEPAAVAELARAADGSMRDALSLLDQMLVFAGGRVTAADAATMLGTIDRQHVARLLDRLADGDARGLMQAVAAMDEQSPDYATALDALAALLQKVALHQAVPELADDESYDPAMLAGFAARLPAADLQVYYQVALLGRRDLALAPEPRGGFEMVLLRMLAFRPAEAITVAAAPAATRPAPASAARSAVASATDPVAPPARAAVPTAIDLGDWPAVVARLELTGPARQIAQNSVLLGRDGRTLRLGLDARATAMKTKGAEDRFRQALAQLLGDEVRLDFEVIEAAPETPARREERDQQDKLEQARQSLAEDPTVRALQERLGAVLPPGGPKPLGER